MFVKHNFTITFQKFDTMKNPHKRTGVLGVQADFVLIYRVFSAKSA